MVGARRQVIAFHKPQSGKAGGWEFPYVVWRYG